MTCDYDCGLGKETKTSSRKVNLHSSSETPIMGPSVSHWDSCAWRPGLVQGPAQALTAMHRPAPWALQSKKGPALSSPSPTTPGCYSCRSQIRDVWLSTMGITALPSSSISTNQRKRRLIHSQAERPFQQWSKSPWSFLKIQMPAQMMYYRSVPLKLM